MSKNINTSKKFFKKSDVERLRFYQIPKVLVEREQYYDLGLAEKLVYGILLDRTLLSMKNNWFDENGYAYILFSGETLGDVLKVHEKTARKYINNLKKFNLLEEKRMGRGLSNRIYLVQPEYIESDIYVNPKIEEPKVTTLSDIQSEKSYPQGESIDINKKEQKVPSRRNKRSVLEGTKSSPNDTDISDTEFIETQSIIQEESEESLINMNERMNDINTQYKVILKNIEIDFIDSIYKKAVKESIKTLCFSKSIKTNNMIIPQEIVLEDLKDLKFSHIEFALETYKERSALDVIRNPIMYLAMIIYNSINDKDIRINSELRNKGVIY